MMPAWRGGVIRHTTLWIGCAWPRSQQVRQGRPLEATRPFDTDAFELVFERGLKRTRHSSVLRECQAHVKGADAVGQGVLAVRHHRQEKLAAVPGDR